ncbi:carbonic anhydrase [Streptomyces capparidis]
MQSLIDHARGFSRKIADRRDDFAELAKGQHPQALFIACSDSRVIPALITGARPGEIFELRTAGNIVPEYRPDATCGVTGTIEFAVEALGVPDIVVCGHSHCGAVKGLLQKEAVRSLPLMGRWLDRSGFPADLAAPVPDGTDPAHAAQRHLLNQLDHLRGHPCVAARLAEGRLRLHAWYYTVETGEVLTHRPDTDRFEAL